MGQPYSFIDFVKTSPNNNFCPHDIVMYIHVTLLLTSHCTETENKYYQDIHPRHQHGCRLELNDVHRVLKVKNK